MRRNPLTVEQVLAWADSWKERLGRWPTASCGRIPQSRKDNWHRVDSALRLGLRGLPGGSSLARLLDKRRGVRNLMDLSPLTVPQILVWADAHRKRTGGWPNDSSGPIVKSHGENWRIVDRSLRGGWRGLPGGSSLARLLEQYRGVRNLGALPRYSVDQVLAWADAYYQRNQRWPTYQSGPIEDAPGETWLAVHSALHRGRRGFPGGSTLRRLLAAQRGLRHPEELPRLTPKQILGWADAYHQETGEWPTHGSGTISGTDGETWARVNSALKEGWRGLPGGSSLSRLLLKRRKVPQGARRRREKKE